MKTCIGLILLFFFATTSQAYLTPIGGGGGSGVSSVNTRTGAVTLSSSDVGLGNVDNTSDASKPVSTATQSALNALNLTGIQNLKNVYVDSTTYTTVQAAINHAETLACSDTGSPVPGCAVIIPAGHWAEDVTIHKNVSLRGAGRGVTFIKSITVRPFSLSVGQAQIELSNLYIGADGGAGLVVSNQTTPSSGIFNITTFLAGGTGLGLVLQDDFILTGVVSNFIAGDMSNVEVGSDFTITNVGNFQITASIFPQLEINSDTSPSGSLVNDTEVIMDVSSVTSAGITATQVSGAHSITLFTDASYLSNVVAGAGVTGTISGGSLLGSTLAGSTLGVSADSPYSQSTPGNWSAATPTVQAALDNLSTHVTPVGVTLSTSTSQPSCDSTKRGLMWVIQGGSGVKDLLQICTHLATNAYSWSTVTTTP